MPEGDPILLQLGQVIGKTDGMEKAVGELQKGFTELRDGQSAMSKDIAAIGDNVKLALQKMEGVETRCDRRHPKGTAPVGRKDESKSALVPRSPSAETLGQFFSRMGVKILEGVCLAVGVGTLLGLWTLIKYLGG